MSNAYLNRFAGLGLFGLAAVAALPALAADLDYPYPGPEAREVYREERVEEHLPPPPPPRPVHHPRFTGGPVYAPPPPQEECRTTLTRRVEFDGDEVERRVSVCEDAPGYRPPPRPRLYGPGPVPPVAVPDERW